MGSYIFMGILGLGFLWSFNFLLGELVHAWKETGQGIMSWDRQNYDMPLGQKYRLGFYRSTFWWQFLNSDKK